MEAGHLEELLTSLTLEDRLAELVEEIRSKGKVSEALFNAIDITNASQVTKRMKFFNRLQFSGKFQWISTC